MQVAQPEPVVHPLAEPEAAGEAVLRLGFPQASALATLLSGVRTVTLRKYTDGRSSYRRNLRPELLVEHCVFSQPIMCRKSCVYAIKCPHGVAEASAFGYRHTKASGARSSPKARQRIAG